MEISRVCECKGSVCEDEQSVISHSKLLEHTHGYDFGQKIPFATHSELLRVHAKSHGTVLKADHKKTVAVGGYCIFFLLPENIVSTGAQ